MRQLLHQEMMELTAHLPLQVEPEEQLEMVAALRHLKMLVVVEEVSSPMEHETLTGITTAEAHSLTVVTEHLAELQISLPTPVVLAAAVQQPVKALEAVRVAVVVTLAVVVQITYLTEQAVEAVLISQTDLISIESQQLMQLLRTQMVM
jgi:hypothetical protein